MANILCASRQEGLHCSFRDLSIPLIPVGCDEEIARDLIRDIVRRTQDVYLDVTGGSA